jgi:ABC-type transport system involved in multi-copper enzyme maturation permease subunit
MLWLTWRQLRASAASAAAALALLAAVFALTGPRLADDFSVLQAECGADGFSCTVLGQEFFHNHRSSFLAASVLVLTLPALAGLFWGAPLITRELEAGTHLLAWNQSVTRTRWLAVKLAAASVAAMAVAGLGSLAVTWWASPIDTTAAADFPRMAPLLFPARGLAPVGYAAFALALGVAVGMLARRTLPAMAITLVAFVAVQLAMPAFVRPHVVSPVRSTIEISDENAAGFAVERVGPDRVSFTAGGTGAWILSSRTLDASGNAVDAIDVSRFSQSCDPLPGEPEPAEVSRDPRECFFAEATELGYRQEVTYQPARRFWPIQWIETGLYVALALGLAAFSLWRFQRPA